MPRTTLGRWAGGLSFVSVVLFAWVVIGLNTGILERGALLAIVSGTGMMVAGLGAFLLALVSRYKHRDRSLVVLVAVIVGALLFPIIVMELAEGLMMMISPPR